MLPRSIKRPAVAPPPVCVGGEGEPLETICRRGRFKLVSGLPLRVWRVCCRSMGRGGNLVGSRPSVPLSVPGRSPLVPSRHRSVVRGRPYSRCPAGLELFSCGIPVVRRPHSNGIHLVAINTPEGRFEGPRGSRNRPASFGTAWSRTGPRRTFRDRPGPLRTMRSIRLAATVYGHGRSPSQTEQHPIQLRPDPDSRTPVMLLSSE